MLLDTPNEREAKREEKVSWSWGERRERKVLCEKLRLIKKLSDLCEM